MWFVLAILTAIFTSVNDVFTKKAVQKVDVYVAACAWTLITLPFFYVLVIVEKFPGLGPHFWEALLAQIIISTWSFLLYLKAFQASDLSITVPMLTFTPLFLLITSPLLLGEFPNPIGIWGILLIVVGSYVLNVQEQHKGYLTPLRCLLKERGTRYMLGVAALFSIGANIDKIGVLNSSPMVWVAASNTALFIIFLVLMRRKSAHWGQQVRTGWKYLLGLGLANTLALICQMEAIRLTLVPYLIAIKRLSVVMTSLCGFFIFKEKGLKERLVGTILMVLGALIISVAHS